MKTIFYPIFQSVIKRRDVKLFMAFTFLPFITSMLMNAEGIETTFKADKTVSFISFLASNLTFQMSMVLPILILSFVIYSVFREEFDSGIMFLYKDIKRNLIFKAKVTSIISLYAIYSLTTTLISAIAYYFMAAPRYHFSGNLLPSDVQALQSIILQLLAVVAINLIVIMLVSALSLKFRGGVAAMAGVFLALWANVAPQFTTVRYLFPTGYATMLEQFNFPLALVISLVISLLYFTIAYIFTYRNFLKKEF